MALTYAEFDTTWANLIADIKTRVTASSDWADITYSGAALLSTSVAPSAGATTLTFTSTTGFPLVSGQSIAIDTSSAREYRTINTVTGTTITLTAGLTNAHASGVGVYPGGNLLKATTTRGAQMVLDLTDGQPTLQNFQIGFYRTHDGTANGGVDRLTKYIYWRQNTTGALSTMPIHCTVSAGKEHLYISIEGPRPGESGASSTTGGSLRGYLFMCDIEPYHVADTTPAVCCGTSQVSQAPANQGYPLSMYGYVSRNIGNTVSWPTCKLWTLNLPGANSSIGYIGSYVMDAVGDGKSYVFPFVVMEDVDGIRGRLSKIFNAGHNDTQVVGEPAAPVGRKITYASETYKLVAPNKNDSSFASDVWGTFGTNNNNGNANYLRSIVIAVLST